MKITKEIIVTIIGGVLTAIILCFIGIESFESDDDPDIPINIPSESSSDTPSDTPSESSSDTLSDTPSSTPSDTPKKLTLYDFAHKKNIFPKSHKKRLNREDVENMSADLIRYGRNEIFARHYYKFDDEELLDFFCSKSWYKPIYSKSEFNFDILSHIEYSNVEFLDKIEKQLRFE